MIDGSAPEFYVADLRSSDAFPAPLSELSMEGFTGYVAVSTEDSEKRRHTISFATRGEAGFGTEAIETLRSLVAARQNSSFELVLT